MNVLTHSQIPTYAYQQSKGFGYINELKGLYQDYIAQTNLDKLLAKKIEDVNDALRIYLSNREHTYYIFTHNNHLECIKEINYLKDLSELFIFTLNVLQKNTSDQKLKKLSKISLDIVQDFVIKVMEHSKIHKELSEFDGVVDENSQEYKDKIEEIANYILSNDKTSRTTAIQDVFTL